MKLPPISMRFSLCICLCLGIVLSQTACSAQHKGGQYLVNLNGDGFIAEGYDVVAYFKEGKPVQGDPKIVKLYQGAFYAFASEENKQQFEADPEKYVPQYGGYCAYAVSVDKLRPIDPQYFQILAGRLMLQHSQNALDLFSEDIPGNTVKADGHWPGLVQKKAGKQKGYDAPAGSNMVTN